MGKAQRNPSLGAEDMMGFGYRLCPSFYDHWMVLIVGKYQSDETVEWM
jgi:hypothetical protein